jgi:hypothetical protein
MEAAAYRVASFSTVYKFILFEKFDLLENELILDHSVPGSGEMDMFEFTEEPPLYLDSLIESLEEDENDTNVAKCQAINDKATNGQGQTIYDQATNDQSINVQATYDQ